MTSKECLMTIADQQEEYGRIVTAKYIRDSLSDLLAERDRLKAENRRMRRDIKTLTREYDEVVDKNKRLLAALRKERNEQ